MYYAQEHEPTPHGSYGYVPDYDVNWDMFDGGLPNQAVSYMIEEFYGHNKNIVSHSEATKYWIHNLGIQGIRCTKGDVEEAYTACYGHGCEYEWETA